MELLIGMLVLLPLPALVHSITRARRRRMRRSLWEGYDPSPTDQAFRGYKIAQLIVGPSSAWLTGVLSVRYGVDEHATCQRPDCTPPGLDCRCGFYAFRDRARALGLLADLRETHPGRSYVVLTADLDGEVLEYEHGFRAQRQRIVRIEIAGDCLSCRQGGRSRAAGSFVTHPRFRSEQLLREGRLVPQIALPLDSSAVRPLCAEHIPATAARRHTLLALRGMIGTEVTLLPARR